MRLIDADALKEWIDEYVSVFKKSDNKDIKGYIEHQPTIEPKRGEWIKRTHDTLIAQVNFAYCSECGQPIMHEHTRPLWSFCPNCGCAMTKE